MSVELPTTPQPASVSPRPLDYGGDQTPFLGGPVRRIERLGSRMALDVNMPPMLPEVARVWTARLARAKRSSAVLAWPQPGIEIGEEGAPRVSGAGQGGTFLSVDGLPPNKPLKEGWFLSLVAGGQCYLHQITGDVTASAAGAAVLPIEPMLRITPAHGAVVELARPRIEGLVAAVQWTVGEAGLVTLTFAIEERE